MLQLPRSLVALLKCSNNLLTDPRTHSLLKYIVDLWTFQQAIKKLGNKVLPAPKKGIKLQIGLGERVLIKYWKEAALADQFHPKCKGPYSVILATPMTVKVQGNNS
jgi:hypothetical protein